MQFYACQETVQGFQKCLMPLEAITWLGGLAVIFIKSYSKV